MVSSLSPSTAAIMSEKHLDLFSSNLGRVLVLYEHFIYITVWLMFYIHLCLKQTKLLSFPLVDINIRCTHTLLLAKMLLESRAVSDRRFVSDHFLSWNGAGSLLGPGCWLYACVLSTWKPLRETSIFIYCRSAADLGNVEQLSSQFLYFQRVKVQ